MTLLNIMDALPSQSSNSQELVVNQACEKFVPHGHFVRIAMNVAVQQA